MNSSRLAALLALLFALDSIATILAILYAPYPARVPLGSPAAYLNIYIHVPAAMVTYVLYTGAFISAILYLRRRSELLDRYVKSFVTVATAYAAYTLVSGSFWAAESWGSAWNWDPRETGVLLLFLAYLVYFAVRGSIQDPDRAPVVSAVYAIAAYSMVPISYLAPRLAESSLHPTQALLQGFMEQPMVRAFFYSKLILVLLIGLIAVALAVKGLASAKHRRLVGLSASLSAAAMLVLAIALSLTHTGTIARVYASFDNGHRLLVKLSGSYTNVTVLEPPRIQELHGHIVKLVGFNGTTATRAEILVPSCVIADLTFYSLLILALATIILRAGRGAES